MIHDPTQEELRKLFDYRESGNLVWKNGSPRMIGKMAGSINQKGYMRVCINNRIRCLHRMIWIFWNGQIPSEMQIDHINGVRVDNRISNLRLATGKTNMRNLHKSHSDSRTGLLGVTKHKSGKYQAQFDSKYLGLYSTPEEAHIAYLEYKKDTQ